MIEVRECAGGLSFLVRVQPRARRNEIYGEWQGALRVRLSVPPVEGRANEALRRFLADCLNVPLGAVKIASGQRSRLKRVEVQGTRAEQVRAIATFSEARKDHSDR
jgi:uncharacterized protein (TIGR00251 family)